MGVSRTSHCEPSAFICFHPGNELRVLGKRLQLRQEAPTWWPLVVLPLRCERCRAMRLQFRSAAASGHSPNFACLPLGRRAACYLALKGQSQKPARTRRLSAPRPSGEFHAARDVRVAGRVKSRDLLLLTPCCRSVAAWRAGAGRLPGASRYLLMLPLLPSSCRIHGQTLTVHLPGGVGSLWLLHPRGLGRTFLQDCGAAAALCRSPLTHARRLRRSFARMRLHRRRESHTLRCIRCVLARQALPLTVLAAWYILAPPCVALPGCRGG